MSSEKNRLSSSTGNLRSALDNKEFFLCYQPVIDLRTQKIICLEALLRWKHPERGVISPEHFIYDAEGNGMILPIGEYVLDSACGKLKELRDMGYSNCGVSVNVSSIQLQHPNFAETVMDIHNSAGLQWGHLTLEITESKCIDSSHIAENNLKYLKKQGVEISIDDFCTGFCSLEYLKRFPIDNLKIDRTFIADINVEVNRAIIEMIISLGHKLNMHIIAEGVETKEQCEYLINKGCDMIQGFYFSKPVLPEYLPGLLKSDYKTD